MYGVSPFASQLLVSDSTVSDMRHSHLKAVPVSNEVLFGSAIVEAKHLFVYVAEQVERLYGNVRTLQSALEQAPEILKAVCVDLPLDVAFRMVNRLVNEVLIVKALIGHESIGIDRALGCDMSTDFRLQMMLAASRDDVRVNLPAAFQNADYWCLVFYSAFGNDALASRRMHESSRTADESLVYFHFATGAAEFHKVLVMQGETNAVHHKPCGLLSDSERARDLIGTYSILSVHDEPNGNHPLVHPERRILEDSSDFDSKLFLASFTEPNAASRDKRVLRGIAARASNFACRPAQRHRIVESLLRVGEKANCFLQRLGKLECFVHA